MGTNLLIAMSGGTTTVINATLAGIVKEARRSRAFRRIFAGFPGISGILTGSIVELTELSDEALRRLRVTPGSSSIGTTRVNILTPNDMAHFEQFCQQWDIRSFINIGGNGTIKQTRAISSQLGTKITVAAAPKTVDNDLGDDKFEDVFFTPGFPSCVNHWITLGCLLNIENIGACSHDQVLIGQTFGRETGFLAGAVRMADPERQWPLIIMLPEDQRPLEKVLDAIDSLLTRFGRAIVVMSEGYHVGNIGQVYDATGQVMYGTSKTTGAQLLVDALLEIGIQARSFIPTILQRQCFYNTLEFDLDIAERLGMRAVSQLGSGDSEFLVSCKSPAKNAKAIDVVSFRSFNNYSRCLPPQFIRAGCFDVSDNYLQYLRDLFLVSHFEKNYASPQEKFFMPNELVLAKF